MKNYIQEGEVFDHVAGSAITSGAIVVVGDMVGVAQNTVASGEKVAVSLEGVYELPKVSGAITLGAKLYHSSGSVTTNDNSGANVFVGWAWTAAASGDATVQVKLKMS